MKDLSKLKNQFGKNIPYYELLNSKEWKQKRNSIIIRDNKKCRKCGKEGFDLYKDKTIYKKGVGWILISVPANVEQIVTTETVKIKRPQGTTQDTRLTSKWIQKEVKNPTFLHVHHNYYIMDKFPWEYNDKALITVCSDCHSEIHRKVDIPIFKTEEMIDDMKLTPCFRCNGEGVFPQFKHVSNGICFRCGGAKFEELTRDIDRLEVEE